jgi:hypothetical protein
MLAQVIIHAEIANEFSREQVGVEAVERVAGVRGLANDKEARQELTNSAGVDVAVRVSRVKRGMVVCIDGAEICEPVLLAQA